MKSIDELKGLSARMQTFLEKKGGSEPNDLIQRAEDLIVLIAQSGSCLADAKFIQDTAIGQAIQKAINLGYTEKLTPSAVNQFVKAEAKEFNHLVNTFDRINATATHALDGVRSMLSYRKSEMNL